MLWRVSEYCPESGSDDDSHSFVTSAGDSHNNRKRLLVFLRCLGSIPRSRTGMWEFPKIGDPNIVP